MENKTTNQKLHEMINASNCDGDVIRMAHRIVGNLMDEYETIDDEFDAIMDYADKHCNDCCD